MPYVEAGAVRLHYVEQGTGDEPLVFVHGYTSSRRTWEPILPYLPARYHAYFFDLRGAGESDKPDDRPYGPPLYAEDIHLATRALGLDTFPYIGHSMGGVTGMQLAVSHPERLRRLVLVAPAPSNGLQIDAAFHAQAKAMRADRPARKAMMRTLAARPTSEAFHDRRIDDDLAWTDSAYEQAWQGMLDIRLADALTRLNVPTLMVAGDRDFLRAANLEDAQRIPNCALHVFYRAGHEIPHDVPSEFMHVVDDFIQHGPAPANPLLQRPTTVTSGQPVAGSG